MNLKERFGYWKDTAVKIKGDAVKSFTAMFLQMWGMSDPANEDYEKYLGALPTELDDKNVGNVSEEKKMLLAETDAASETELLQKTKGCFDETAFIICQSTERIKYQFCRKDRRS